VEILHSVVISSHCIDTIPNFLSSTVVIIFKYVSVAFLVGAVFQDHMLVLLNVSILYVSTASQVFPC
jgi:hypothetical protein